MTRRRQPKASRFVSHGGTSLGVRSDEAGGSVGVTGRPVCLTLESCTGPRPPRRCAMGPGSISAWRLPLRSCRPGSDRRPLLGVRLLCRAGPVRARQPQEAPVPRGAGREEGPDDRRQDEGRERDLPGPGPGSAAPRSRRSSSDRPGPARSNRWPRTGRRSRQGASSPAGQEASDEHAADGRRLDEVREHEQRDVAALVTMIATVLARVIAGAPTAHGCGSRSTAGRPGRRGRERADRRPEGGREAHPRAVVAGAFGRPTATRGGRLAVARLESASYVAAGGRRHGSGGAPRRVGSSWREPRSLLGGGRDGAAHRSRKPGEPG